MNGGDGRYQNEAWYRQLPYAKLKLNVKVLTSLRKALEVMEIEVFKQIRSQWDDEVYPYVLENTWPTSKTLIEVLDTLRIPFDVERMNIPGVELPAPAVVSLHYQGVQYILHVAMMYEEASDPTDPARPRAGTVCAVLHRILAPLFEQPCVILEGIGTGNDQRTITGWAPTLPSELCALLQT